MIIKQSQAPFSNLNSPIHTPESPTPRPDEAEQPRFNLASHSGASQDLLEVSGKIEWNGCLDHCYLGNESVMIRKKSEQLLGRTRSISLMSTPTFDK